MFYNILVITYCKKELRQTIKYKLNFEIDSCLRKIKNLFRIINIYVHQ